jgi:hypothetical protein
MGIGKYLIVFILIIALVFGGSALLLDGIQLPKGIGIYIIGAIVIMGIVNTVSGILNGGSKSDDILGEQSETIEGNVYNVPGIGVGFETSNGKKFVVRETRDKSTIGIHEVKNGKMEPPLIIPRNQAAYHINRRARK